MWKIWVIARREYLAMVATKGFLIGIFLVPVLMIGGAFVPRLLRNQVDLDDKVVVVLDQSGGLFPLLEKAAAARNDREVFDPDTGVQKQARYRLEAGPAGAPTDEQLLQLSDRVRKRELFGFVDIPPNVREAVVDGAPPQVLLYAENAALSDVRRWLEQTLNDIVRNERLQVAGIDAATVQRASTPVPISTFSLFERTRSGEVKKAVANDRMYAIFFPFGIMMVMFMIIWMAAQPILECILEEKQLRIGEVLLGSARPFQIMAGKLLGSVAGSLTTVAIYFAAGCALAAYNDAVDRIPWSIVPWFLVYQVLAVLMVSSAFLAVAAAAADLKEASGLLVPVWILLMIPLFVWVNIASEPNSTFAVWASLIPPGTPLLMILRMTASSTIPTWQPVLGVVLVFLATVVCLFAAGRIFRIGILAQGKTPKLGELLRWVVTG